MSPGLRQRASTKGGADQLVTLGTGFSRKELSLSDDDSKDSWLPGKRDLFLGQVGSWG